MGFQSFYGVDLKTTCLCALISDGSSDSLWFIQMEDDEDEDL